MNDIESVIRQTLILAGKKRGEIEHMIGNNFIERVKQRVHNEKSANAPTGDYDAGAAARADDSGETRYQESAETFESEIDRMKLLSGQNMVIGGLVRG